MTSNQYIVFYLTIIGLFIINYLFYSIWIRSIKKRLKNPFYLPNWDVEAMDSNRHVIKQLTYWNWLWFRKEVNYKTKVK